MLILIMAAVCYPYFGTVPFYDGCLYNDCLMNAVLHPSNPSSYACEGHPSFIYILIHVLFQFLLPGSAAMIDYVNFALAAVSVIFFFRLACLASPPTSNRECFEIYLLTALYALSPSLLTHIFHFDADFGVLVFLLPFLFYLLTHKRLLALIFGCCMIMSKETGLGIYLCLLAAHAIFYITRGAGDVKSKLWAIQKQLVFALPLILFISGAAYMYFQAKHTAFELIGRGPNLKNLRKAFSLGIFDWRFPMAIYNLFFLNFHWWLTVILLRFFGSVVYRWLFALPTPPTFKHPSPIQRFILLSFVLVFFVTTRVVPYNYTRYLLPAYPLLYLVFGLTLNRLAWKPALRLGYIGVAITLFGLSLVRTFDPLDRAIFGTFSWGKLDGLDRDSLLNQNRANRDSIAYNLQFLNLHPLMNKAFSHLGSERLQRTALAAGMGSSFCPGRVDTRTAQRTSSIGPNTWMPVFYDSIESLNQHEPLPPEIIYFYLPNLGKNDFRDTLVTDLGYQRQEETIFTHSGYELRIEVLKRSLPPTSPD